MGSSRHPRGARAQGLWLAKMGLERADEAFERPGWIGEEVSGDARYQDVNLAVPVAEGR